MSADANSDKQLFEAIGNPRALAATALPVARSELRDLPSPTSTELDAGPQVQIRRSVSPAASIANVPVFPVSSANLAADCAAPNLYTGNPNPLIASANTQANQQQSRQSGFASPNASLRSYSNTSVVRNDDDDRNAGFQPHTPGVPLIHSPSAAFASTQQPYNELAQHSFDPAPGHFDSAPVRRAMFSPGGNRSSGCRSISPDSMREATANLRVDSANIHTEHYEKQLCLLELARIGEKNLSRPYTADDSLADMQFEIKRFNIMQEEKQTVSMMSEGLKMGINFIEAGVSNLRLMDLAGWSDVATKDMSKYDRALLRLYKKYWKKQTIAPEAELAWALGSSMAQFQFSKRFETAGANGSSGLQNDPAPFAAAGSTEAAQKYYDSDSSDEDEAPPQRVSGKHDVLERKDAAQHEPETETTGLRSADSDEDEDDGADARSGAMQMPTANQMQSIQFPKSLAFL